MIDDRSLYSISEDWGGGDRIQSGWYSYINKSNESSYFYLSEAV